MPRARNKTRHMTSRLGFKFPTLYAWVSNSLSPGKQWRQVPGICPGSWGEGGGVLKLRFDRYISVQCFGAVICLYLSTRYSNKKPAPAVRSHQTFKPKFKTKKQLKAICHKRPKADHCSFAFSV